jgi:RNA polymerase sigma-70 factor (ECF subfamily)
VKKTDRMAGSFMVLHAQNITSLLQAARQGDSQSAEKLMSAVYTDLRKVARRYMASERVDHTLQPTAVVNDVLLRLFPRGGAEQNGSCQSVDIDWRSRVHFLGVAARQMRQVLIDHARQKRAVKRSFGIKIPLEDVNPGSIAKAPEFEFETLNQLLDLLATRDKNAAKVVELKFFGGLTYEEAAEVMNTSEAQVRRDWEFARLWLRHRMS